MDSRENLAPQHPGGAFFMANAAP